jgi:hypothetical protein
VVFLARSMREIGGRVLGEVSEAAYGRSRGDCCREGFVANSARCCVEGLMDRWKRTGHGCLVSGAKKSEPRNAMHARPMRAKN